MLRVLEFIGVLDFSHHSITPAPHLLAHFRRKKPIRNLQPDLTIKLDDSSV
jgi:hypothetical protein